MLYDSSERVAVTQEISYIEKYISLQQLRFENPMSIKINITGNVEEMKLPPLLLIPFVENAFKHGKVTEDAEWLWIDMNVDEAGRLLFSCINTKVDKRKDVTGGIGIENVKKRLELLFNKHYSLDINETHDQFKVRLELKNEK